MKALFYKKIYITFALAAVFLPRSVFASTVYISTDRSDFYVGDSIIFTLRVDSENKKINSIDGGVVLDYPTESVSLVDINTAGSGFSLWPTKPLPSLNNTSISFAGGYPGGFTSKDAIVFNAVLKLQKTGTVTLSPNNIGVYLHDGKGTKDGVNIKNLAINVLPKTSDAEPTNDWSTVIASDKTAPQSFEVTRGKDPFIFGNQHFISFFTTDLASGVAYYEAQEGDRGFTRAESPYLLQDQSLASIIQVKAVDKAGNEKIEKLMPPLAALFNKNILFWIFILLVVVALVYVLWRKFKRKLKA